MANSTNKRSVKPLLETPAFPVTQGISAKGIGQQVIVKNLFGHVSAVVEVLSDIEY